MRLVLLVPFGKFAHGIYGPWHCRRTDCAIEGEAIVSAKRRPGGTGPSRRGRQEAGAAGRADSAAPITALSDGRVRLGLIIVALVLATIVVIGADYAFGVLFGNGSGSVPAASQSAAASSTAVRTEVGLILRSAE